MKENKPSIENMLEQQAKKKKDEKKDKVITLSEEVYREMRENIMKIFV